MTIYHFSSFFHSGKVRFRIGPHFFFAFFLHFYLVIEKNIFNLANVNNNN